MFFFMKELQGAILSQNHMKELKGAILAQNRSQGSGPVGLGTPQLKCHQ